MSSLKQMDFIGLFRPTGFLGNLPQLGESLPAPSAGLFDSSIFVDRPFAAPWRDLVSTARSLSVPSGRGEPASPIARASGAAVTLSALSAGRK